jgi:hypothetical protein
MGKYGKNKIGKKVKKKFKKSSKIQIVDLGYWEIKLKELLNIVMLMELTVMLIIILPFC